jgi:hypothetical protein
VIIIRKKIKMVMTVTTAEAAIQRAYHMPGIVLSV